MATALQVSGGTFGDAVGGRAQILALDRVKEVARIQTRSIKHLIVLAVVPGREIELLVPGESVVQRERQAGQYSIDLRRVGDNTHQTSDDLAAMRAYEQCVARAAAARRRAEQQKRPVKRDSTGKILSDGAATVAPSGVDVGVECNRLDRANRRSSVKTYLPARPAAERYLVVLSSTAAVPVTLIAERSPP